MTLTINASDLFVGTEYTVNYTLCNAWGDYYEENTEDYSYWCEYYIGEGDEQANTVQGEVSFIATTSSHTETITIADPGCCGDWNYSDNGLETQEGIQNESMLFKVTLDVQNVYLTENTSGAFVLGGEVTEIYIDYQHDNLLLTMGSSGSYDFELDYSNMYILDYDVSCGLYDSATDNLVDSDSEVQAPEYSIYGDFELQPTAEGDHYVQCTLTREFDGAIIATAIGDTFSVISDEGNQDDASITVEVSVDPVEDWGTVSMLAIDLDAGQGYTINWMVTDDSPNGGGILMIANDHIWVAGSSGTEEYVLEFHDLSDTTNACISVTLVAGETELQTVSGVCWDSHSTSDFDGDGVYDKDDMCENTPSGTVVQANGCSDTDNDGWTDSAEIECSTLVNDANSIPVDTDGDGICDYLDTDDDNDGYMDEIELLSGTNPLDPNDYPANQLPVCSIHYSLEVDGIPMEITGEAVIPTLPVGTGVTPEITVPAGSYYLIAVCVDPDNDPITVTVNDVTVGPMTGEVKAGAIVVIEAGVDESVEATITWTDGTNTATTNVIVNLDGDMSGTGTGLLPGFTAMLGLVAMLGAALVIRTKPE